MQHIRERGEREVARLDEIWNTFLKRGMESRYVGGHPMAGTQNSGWDHSQIGLFKRSPRASHSAA